MLEWTAQTAVIAAVLAGAVALACRARRIGPVAKHALWTVVLVKLLLPPRFVLNMPWRTPAALAPVIAEPPAEIAPDARDNAIVDVTSAPTMAPAAESIQIPPTSHAAPASPWARPLTLGFGIWLIGALIFFVVQLARVVRLGRRVRNGVDADPDLAADVTDVACGLGVTSISTRVVDGLTSPVMWCVRPLRPQLLWPAHLLSDLSPACRRALVVHELAHVKRRDHWIGWIELVAGCAWWWNPMFWYVRAQVRENAELACDGWVIHSLPNGRRAYAEALLTICSRPAGAVAPMPVLSAGGGSRRILERRLTMIMKGQIPVRLPRIGVISVIALGALALPAWAQRPTTVATTTGTQQTATTASTTRPEVPIEVVPEPSQGRTVVVSRPSVATTVQGRGTPQVRVLQRAPLPEDAQKVFDKYSEQEAQVRKEMEAKLQDQRAALVKELQTLQDSYTKAGKLDEAVAIRDRIRQLQATPAGVTTLWTVPMLRERFSATPAPGYAWTTPPNVANTPLRSFTRDGHTFTFRNDAPAFFFGGGDTVEGLRGHVGESFTIPVIGNTSGPLWGTGTFTDDSSISTAAVHAGLVENGKLGFVRVTILPGREKYDGSASHGVTSQSWSSHGGSFKVDRETSKSPVLQLMTPDGQRLWSLPMFRGQNNVSLQVEVVGTNEGVWGTDVYTDDSSIGGAAVHAGILKVGEKGVVKITILGGRDSYQGSSRNGVKSESFAAWPGSFKIEKK